METSLNRIKKDIEAIKEFNSTKDKGCTRFSYSIEDKNAKDYLIAQLEELGINAKVDGVGNLRGTLKGEDEALPVIVLGSHLDTVKYGGDFDGVAGVVSALEVIRVLKENKVITKHSVEFIAFAEEEGSNFGITTLGSKALVGKIDISDLKE